MGHASWKLVAARASPSGPAAPPVALPLAPMSSAALQGAAGRHAVCLAGGGVQGAAVSTVRFDLTARQQQTGWRRCTAHHRWRAATTGRAGRAAGRWRRSRTPRGRATHASRATVTQRPCSPPGSSHKPRGPSRGEPGAPASCAARLHASTCVRGFQGFKNHRASRGLCARRPAWEAPAHPPPNTPDRPPFASLCTAAAAACAPP